MFFLSFFFFFKLKKKSETQLNQFSLSDNDTIYPPPRKSARIQARREGSSCDGQENDEKGHDSDSSSSQDELNYNNDTSPLDSESSCSDSDEEELRKNRALLPFPLRLIGSAIKCSPELLAATKQLIQIQKSKLLIEKQKLLLETRQLELMNSKLELEVRTLERNLAAEIVEASDRKDTTIYLQASQDCERIFRFVNCETETAS